MYNHYKNNYQNSRNGSPKRPQFGAQRRGRVVKKLDSNLFIKKAQAPQEAENHLSEMNFSSFEISEKLKRNIADHNYVHPTLIQEQAIPHLLAGRDVIGLANTGTGKTAAFLVPLVNKMLLDRNQRALIVVPTRELALQILEELKVFKRGTDLNAAICIGGASMNRQEAELHHNPHFVIGTPGRLKDLAERRKLNLQMFQNVVLDEVDRMVDIGFIRDIRYFIANLPTKRQSIFFSATIPPEVTEVLQKFVTNPVTVTVKSQDHKDNIEQDIVKVGNGRAKIDILHDLLIQDGFDKVMIFGRTKWGVEKLSKELVARGFKATAIHGNKSLNQRKRALEDFKRNAVKILLATDVASRGLDIENVTHVINYDAPESHEDYTHRIGRTGRAGKSGIALTFVE